MTLELKKTILYGPVQSRRYGRSLGVNLMPHGGKLCSFNCVYCQYGNTTWCLAHAAPLVEELPSVDDVARAVEEALRGDTEFDQITFSGNGEPTLHPDFPAIVEVVADLRDLLRPDVRLGLLSNSTGIVRPDVREALARIDIPVMKLDAGSAELFEAINRPASEIDYNGIVQELAETGNIYLQTLLMDGSPSNVTDDALAKWMDKLSLIHPVEAQIYSLDRPTAETTLSVVPSERLEQIALEAHKATGVKVKPFYRKK